MKENDWTIMDNDKFDNLFGFNEEMNNENDLQHQLDMSIARTLELEDLIARLFREKY